MKKSIFVIALTSMSLAVTASAQDDAVRLVVTAGSNAQAKSATVYSAKASSGPVCVTTPSGDGQWCIEKRGPKLSGMASQQSATSLATPDFQVVELPSYGFSAEVVAVILNEDGRLGLVEVDAPVSTPDATSYKTSSTSYASDIAINDPDYSAQLAYYSAPDLSHPSGMDVLGAWDMLGELQKGEPIDVIVFDSSFYQNDEIPYFDGRNFSTTALIKDGPSQLRNNNYAPPIGEELAETDLLCDGHGLGVASTIAGTINNEIAGAGLINNVHVYAIKTLTCGTGFLSDTAEALNWLAGKKFEGVTPYQGKPGIVNISLGGGANSCPSFMQDSINEAVAAGFTVFSAAGNGGVNVSNFTPANCDNVISVGAVDSNADLASFSNFGAGIEVVTHGKGVIGVCDEGSTSACYWEGTSFSTPLIAGVAAIVKQATGASDELLKKAIRVTSSPAYFGSGCSIDMCGAGVLNAKKLLEFATKDVGDTLNSISFALDANTACDQTWFLDFFGNNAHLCELYKVTFMGGYTNAGTTYKLLSIASTDDWLVTSPYVEGEFDKGNVVLRALDPDNRKYAVQYCIDGICDEIIEMNTAGAKAAKRPIACLNK